MTDVEIRRILPPDASRLDLRNRPRLDEALVASLVIEAPGASFWVPATGEFVLVTPWRHRRELVTILASTCFRHEADLIDAVVATARTRAVALMHADIDELRSPAFYDRHGFRQVEEIVTYDHRRPRQLLQIEDAGLQEFVRLLPHNGLLQDAVLALDHAAFPWVWWNSGEEFDTYLRYPGVEVWAGLHQGEARSYVGITQYRSWAHLDRIATDPLHQGTGFGREALRFAASRMILNGAWRIALSTQGDNLRSRRLYESTGFVRTPDDDYTVRAIVFDDAQMMAGSATSVHDAVSDGRD